MDVLKQHLDPTDHQGGKLFRKVMQEREKMLDEINQEFLTDDTYKDEEEFEEKLQLYKEKFLEFELDDRGEINYMSLKMMLEKIGQAKTHREVMKMIKEVDTTGSGTISYREFIIMMLRSKHSVLRLILFFESVVKPEEVKKGPPPKRSLDSLP